ncbi:MAG TPA: hypothetical protein VLD86_07735, partial [Ilumatobacteraceae bacterium]|nr:hypothetical protein [Ilumatobacteraceae bacterium]
RIGQQTATVDVDDVLRAVDEGRVETLLVHDDDQDGPVTTSPIAGAPVGSRITDAAIVAALRTSAEVYVVPKLAILSGPIAALFRW